MRRPRPFRPFRKLRNEDSPHASLGRIGAVFGASQRLVASVLIAVATLIGHAPAQIPTGSVWDAPDPGVSGAAVLAVVPESEQQARQSLRLLARIADEVDPMAVVLFSERVRSRSGKVVVREGSAIARERIERYVDERGTGVAVIIDANSQVLFAGRIDLDLVDEARDLEAGRLDPVDRRASVARASLAAAPLESFVERHHWTAHVAALRNAARETDDDLENARSPARQFAHSWRALESRPFARLRFLDEVMDLVAGLVESAVVRRELARLQRAAPRSPMIQLVSFEAAVRSGRFNEAQSAGFAWLETQKGLPGRVDEFLDVLDDVPGAADALPRLADRAVRIGLHAEPENRRLLMRAFDQRRWLDEDMPGAREAGRAVLRALEGDAQALNSFAWKLLTTEGYAGHFDVVALEAAKAMETDPRWRTSWRLDTYALARFVNGDLDGAIEFQREALTTCGAGARARYQQRLERYEAARR